MQRLAYNRRVNFKNIGALWIIPVFLIASALLFFMLYINPFSDRVNYKKYKNYELNVSKKEDAIIANVTQYTTDYNAGKLTKKQFTNYLRQEEREMERLYDSFKWKRGDTTTKELYAIKKEIIISYAQIFRNKADGLNDNIKYVETDDINFITSLKDRYNQKEMLEKQSFKLNII